MPLSALLALALAAPAPAAPAMPDTDIYLYALRHEGGRPSLGQGQPLSAQPGYDNQPSFSHDGRFVLYTAQKDGKQTEIWRYDIAEGKSVQLTHTPESEYSPRLSPDGQHFTVVRVEADGTQRLWRFRADGSAPELVLKTVKPVGYYAYAGTGAVYAFVLGEPHELQRIELESGKAEVKARDIGRGLASLPDGGVSYVQMDKAKPRLRRVDAQGRDEELFPLFDGEGDYAWLPDASGVLSAKDGRLYLRRAGMGDWQAVASAQPLPKAISRLAVSPDGRWLALVASLTSP